MKKSKNSKLRFLNKRSYSINLDDVSNHSLISALHNSWNNLPYDMDIEERLMFIEIAEKAVRMQNRIKGMTLLDDMDKN